MPAYYIAEHIITDPAKFEEYRLKVAPMIASYGGRYITKAGSHKFPESAALEAGTSRHHRVSKYGAPRCLVHVDRVSTADGLAQAVHFRFGHDHHA